jgi:DNA-binding GntR family transcriptional regulator
LALDDSSDSVDTIAMRTEMNPPHAGDRPSGGTLSDSVFEHLLQAIHSGQLAPGAVLNEVALAQELGVSRGPVREAVRRLQGVQLVEREAYLRARVVELTASAARELFEMREALEGMACRLAALRMSEDDIDRLAADLEAARALRKSSSGRRARSAGSFDFHDRIAVASRNSRIHSMLAGDLRHLLRLYRIRSGAVPHRKDNAFAEHWQVLRAIRARDADLAESLMRSHVRRAAEQLFRELPAHGAAVTH